VSGRKVWLPLARTDRPAPQPALPDATWVRRRSAWEADPDLPLDAEGWTICELTTGQMLLEEGAAMQHCVGTYIRQCAAGGCAIFSVRRDGVRVATLELLPADIAVIQLRGPCNAPVDAATSAAVACWRAGLRASQ